MTACSNVPAWVTILSALLVPTVAVAAAAVAFLQWRTNSRRLKHELFDRRYALFEMVRDYLREIRGSSTFGHAIDFQSDTRGIRFVFDEDLSEYVDGTLLRLAFDLETLDSELKDQTDQVARKEIVRQRRVIKNQLDEESRRLEEKFAKYLQLKH